VFTTFLNAANPFMPIVTECLWEEFVGSASSTLMQQSWPTVAIPQTKGETDVDWAVHFVESVRSLKGLLGLSGGIRVPLISRASDAHNAILSEHWAWISHLTRLESLSHEGTGVPFVVNGSTFELVLGDNVSLDDVKALLQSKKQVLETEIGHLIKKLQNEAFKTAKPELWQADADLKVSKEQDALKIQNILSAW
jgi:valyl-tRNA synthetase